MSRIAAVVTGLGPVTAVGCGGRRFWEALMEGRHGFSPITRCDVSRSPSKIGAEIGDFRLEDFVEHGRTMARQLPRSVQLALAASSLAIEDACVDLDSWDAHRIGLCVGTSFANLADTFEARDQWLASGRAAPDRAFHLFNHSAACVLSSFFDLRGPIHTISSGCTSGLDALGHSLRMIQLGIVDAMLVIGTDCELVQEILAALNASGSLTTHYNDVPAKASRPFDSGRDGIVIGEGAAALWVESESRCRQRDAKPYARLAGYASCSAGRKRRYKPGNPEFDPRPCARALEGALSEAGWNPTEVDLVNANGSSSVHYDVVEARALAQVFGDRFPEVRVHSIKSMLGQHGAGSSALQAVAACLSLRHGAVPPTINHEVPDPACGPIRVVTRPESFGARKVLINSTGMGGFYYSSGAFAAPD